jgi:divalent metal cation (Fe/Co/Zn/Cd) transporter
MDENPDLLPVAAESERVHLYRRGLILAAITVFYNIGEGLVSVLFGLEDETIALFGFGLDSFVEVISGVGIWHMIRRLQKDGDGQADVFERTALRVTGTAFYLLAGGLVLTAALTAVQGRAPETTLWGIIVALVSIVTMWILIRMKTSVGRKLGSAAILADANCTRACLYLSFVLLLSSLGYEMTGIGLLDTAGALFIALFSFREGREAFAKARGEGCACGESSGGACSTADLPGSLTDHPRKR